MRTRDLFSLAARSIRPGFGMAHVLITAFVVVCFCFSVAIWTSVSAEKAEPCELTVTAPSYLDLTEQTVQDIDAIPDVVDAAGLVEVPATVESEKYTASLTLVGIDGDYLEVAYSVGDVFPSDSAMPWIILSEAATKSFVDLTDKTKHDANYMPSIDWLNANFALTVGNSNLSAKVSGVFEGNTVAAYISQDMAKQLLQRQGQPSGYTSAAVRITNIGAAEAVTKAISALGYEVANGSDARQEKWDTQLREAVYILILGLAGFLCSVMVKTADSAVNRLERQRRNTALRWEGAADRLIRMLGFVRYCYLNVAGILLGILLHYAVAAFIPMELRESSNFALTISSMPLGVTVTISLMSAFCISWTLSAHDH